MRVKLTLAALVAAGAVALFGAPAAAHPGLGSGVDAPGTSLVNVDASSAAHWQICGQNVLTKSINQECDNRDHTGAGKTSGVNAGDLSLVNVDASDAAHWQICGQNILVPLSQVQQCANNDHTKK